MGLSMNWDNNNSGPWGGNKKPSSSGSGKKDDNVVDFDIDKFLNDSKSTIRSFMNSGNGGGGSSDGNAPLSSKNPKFFILLGIVLLLAWLATGFYKVNTEEEGVVMRFGKYHRTTIPGLNYHLPVPVETVIKVAVTRINQEEIGSRTSKPSQGYRRRSNARSSSSILKERLMLTGDINIVDVNFVVQWRIDNARDYLFNVRDTYGENTVKNAAESAMREVVGKFPLNAALAQERFAIEQEAEKILQGILDSYGSGIKVERVQMQDSDPPAEVVDAFRSVEAARAQKETRINEAQKYSNKILPEARGEAERIIQDAEAFKQQVVAIAEGDANRFTAVYNKYKTAKEVTKRRIYLETMEDVFQGMDKIILGGEQGGNVLPYLPLSALDVPKKTHRGN